MPKVSVIIPTYNCAQYICDAVDSVLAQTYRDFELIVVDDGSTDNTRELLLGYGDQLQYIYQENKDITGARNTGIENSDGQYLAFLDADDMWLPNKLDRQVRLLDDAPEVGLVYCWHYYIDAEGDKCKFQNNTIGRSFESGSRLYDKLIERNVISGGGSTPIIRQECLEKSGMFDESLPYSGDWDLWLRISMDYIIAYIPEPLGCYRVLDQEHQYKEKFVQYAVGKGLIKVIEKASRLLEEKGYKGHRKLRQKALVTNHLHCADMWAALGNWHLARNHLLKAAWSGLYVLKDSKTRGKLKNALVASLRERPKGI